MRAARQIDWLVRPAFWLSVAAMLGGPAMAEDVSQPAAGFWSGVLEKLDLKTRPGPMPEFVRKTHPDPSKMTFIPTGPAPRNQAVPVKSSDEVEAAKQALDAAQAEQLAANPAAAPTAAIAPPSADPPAQKRKAKPVKAVAAKPKPNQQSD